MQPIAIRSALLMALVGTLGCMEQEGLNARDAGGPGRDAPAVSPDVPPVMDAANDSPPAVDGGAVDASVDANVSDSVPRDGVSSDGEVAAPALLYSASALVGALDRIVINVTDREKDRCLKMVLVSPGLINKFMVAVPPTFVVDVATLFDSGACSQMTVPSGGVPATGGTGSITWPPMLRVYPCSLNIHAAFTFRASEASPLITFRMDADAIPVAGCN